MEIDEINEYQQNEIDGAEEAITDRQKHISSGIHHGLLEGTLIREHQNDRAEAYLEGYADALEFAGREVEGIQNMGQYLSEDPIKNMPPMQVLQRVQELAEDPDHNMQVCDVVTAATNIAEPDEIAENANQREDGPVLSVIGDEEGGNVE